MVLSMKEIIGLKLEVNKFCGTTPNGMVGLLEEKKGSPGWIYGKSDSTCPNNSKNDWTYYDNGWFPTTDVVIDCQ